MANLISLFGYQQKGEKKGLPYVVLHTEAPESVQSLSPDLMRLGEGLYVVDLQIVEPYWQKRAQRESYALQEYLEAQIQRQIPHCSLAVFCDHPFQGLVFFNHLRTLGTEGVFSSRSLFSQKVYQNISWHPWFFSARQVHETLAAAGVLARERKNFFSQLARFQRFVERLDLQEFSALKEAQFFEIRRRFHGLLGQMWQWTFPQSRAPQEEQTSLLTFQHYEQLQGFPWIPFFEDEAPAVEQILEYPVSEWEALQETLLSDLERLSHHPQLQAPYKVMQIQWSLRLFDLSSVEETLSFKFPLCLQQERQEEFSALLPQLQFAFEHFREQGQQSQEWEWINTSLIVGWSLQVTKGLVLSQKTEALDWEEQVQSLHKEDLVRLSHKVPGGLQSFQALPHFIPGLDFAAKDLLTSSEVLEVQTLLQQPQPFYLLPEEQEIPPEQIKQSQFLDRTSSDWWNRQDALDSYRDCYLCELKTQEFVFAYRDYQGRWFRYGI